MNRRKGTPCSCECKPCGSKNPIRALNNISPDPNGDFMIKAGNGIGISEGDNEITIINTSTASSFIAGDNIEINPSGDNLEIRVKDDISVDNVDVSQDVNIGGDLKVTGDIIQQGSSYETHAEQIYTTKDYIYMREGAVSGLSPGDYSGFEVIKYDGTNDGRLVIDNDGVARVGDVGDEQPLLTRDESNDLTDGDSLVWDATNQKAVTQAIPSAISIALAGKQDSITIQRTQLTNVNGISSGGGVVYKYGKVCWASIDLIPTGSGVTVTLSFPTGFKPLRTFYMVVGNYVSSGYALGYFNGTSFSFATPNGNGQCCTFIYMTNE